MPLLGQGCLLETEPSQRSCPDLSPDALPMMLRPRSPRTQLLTPVDTTEVDLYCPVDQDTRPVMAAKRSGSGADRASFPELPTREWW
jgi:hypothetical protein